MDEVLPVLGGMGVYTVDLRDAFKDGGSSVNCSYVSSDGLHPSAAGSYLMAEEVYDVMVANAIVPDPVDCDDDYDDDDDDSGCGG